MRHVHLQARLNMNTKHPLKPSTSPECERDNAWSFGTTVFTTESYWGWLPGSRNRAERRGRSAVKRQLPDQVREMNEDMEAWIKSQECGECDKVVSNRQPASLPGRIVVQDFDSFVQVSGHLKASVDVDCRPN